MKSVLGRIAVGPSGESGDYRPQPTATAWLSVVSAVRDVPYVFLATLWLGALLGVSFLATPVKFQAPSLSLPIALEVGRVTFALFSRVEWGLAALLGVSIALGSRHRGRWLGWLFLIGLLAVEAFWLLPVLDARVGTVIAGGQSAGTSHHLLYVAAESAKALLLLGLSLTALTQLAGGGGRS
jgi:hypothetical protein